MDVHVSDAAWTQQTNRGWEPSRIKTIVYFYDREVQNQFKSEQESRPIFELVTFIKKIPPGDKLLEIDSKASKKDFLNYPEEYEKYQKKQTSHVSGTSLDVWTQLTRSQVAELKALNIFTVEQLASLPDQYGQKFMGFQGMKQKAQSFLRAAQGQAAREKMETLLKSRDEENAKLREEVSEALKGQNALMESIKAMQAQMT